MSNPVQDPEKNSKINLMESKIKYVQFYLKFSLRSESKTWSKLWY